MSHEDELEPPPMLLRRALEEADKAGIRVITGCDANSRHQIWVSSDTNKWDDLTVVAVKDCRDELILLASCYLPHDGEAPTVELQKLVATSSRRKQSLVVGADANAHHTIWGSRDINAKGESLLNFILMSSLVIANREEEPTYIGPTSKNVLDFTLYTSRGTTVENWRVLSTPSFSDHRYIHFSIRKGVKA
ncbi:uncharacterized protein LOC128920130 [Zeugodacus cucurbitae]|uniref:uncharacterized protein LOC128920130 n=1 Tax=Zeugodacus cucurbitae TaxID=28588 RepID=UPI0023D948B4|nr:uncharacterized protein LOC128920130 [Zeugodacus cucurbitae]